MPAVEVQSAETAVRIHAGLEDPDDLIADLERGLERLGASPPA